MDRFHELQVFIAAADTGSFAKAGAKLRISPPSVTRTISSLEDRIGTRLFNRTTRSLSLTEPGLRFLDHARRLLSDLDNAEIDAAGESTTPTGHLTIGASVTFGRAIVAPLMTAFLTAHPRITVSVLLQDRVADLVTDGIDVAIRISHLPDSTLVAKRIGDVRRVLVASPAYLARRGVPAHPRELKLHSTIAFTGLMQNREWRFVNGEANATVQLSPTLEINDAVAAIAAAKAGDGITIALSYMVAEAIEAGTLVPVLDTFAPPAVPVHLVYPHSPIVAPKVRAFVDFAAPRLKKRLDELKARP
ncbi:MAG: LysR family transcriptional regulator [Proteobacteria bacterium]|nr:LysR family transcriptional regulator [Pseudomonadota bacterium]